MKSFLNQLEKHWKTLTLKKLMICMIILIVFIILVRLLFKNNILEGFNSSNTIEDLALIRYEFRDYSDNESVAEGQIVWDNRMYLLQPARYGEPRYSFWSINNNDDANFDNNVSPVKSLGSSINVISNFQPPTKPVMAITQGKYKTLDKYEKIVEVGSDDFNELKLDYTKFKNIKIEELQEVKDLCVKKIAYINNLLNYFNDILTSDMTLYEEQVAEFLEQILEDTILYPISLNNPTNLVNRESVSLANVINNYNSVYQSESDLSTGASGMAAAFSRVPFGTTLSLFSNPGYQRTGSHTDITVPYSANKIYKNKLKEALGVTDTITDSDTLTEEQKECDNYNSNLNSENNAFQAKYSILEGERQGNLSSEKYLNTYMIMKHNEGYHLKTRPKLKGQNQDGRVNEVLREIIHNKMKLPNNITGDANNGLSPYTFLINQIKKSFGIHEIKIRIDIKSHNDKDHTENNWLVSDLVDFHNAWYPQDQKKETYKINLNTSVINDNYIDKFATELSDLPKNLQIMSSHKPSNIYDNNLHLVNLDFNQYHSKKDVNYLNLSRNTYISVDDVNNLNDNSENDKINNYLIPSGQYDISGNLSSYTNFNNLEDTTITKYKGKFNYTLINYEIHPLRSNDKIITEVKSWQFNANDLKNNIKQDLLNDLIKRNNCSKYNQSLLDEIKIKKENLNKNLNILTLFQNFVEKIQTNLIPFPALKVIRPIPPTGYKVLGDIVLSSKKSIKEKNPETTKQLTYKTIGNKELQGKDYIHYQLQKYVAVPESCVKQVREWRDTDKVFEFVQDGKFISVYNNPYTNTIRVTTNKKKPDGYVEKLVACVEECDAVSSLIKTDECAKKLYKTKKSMEGGSSIAPNFADNEENKFYLNKIQNRASYINSLSDKARELQLLHDKNTIINQEHNRAQLQKYVDDQSRNISILSDKLEKGQNTIDMNMYVHPDGVQETTTGQQVGSIDNTVKVITKVINQTSLPEEKKTELVKKVQDYQVMMEDNLISPLDYKIKMNQVLESCPEYDLSGLVKKDVVSDVCYGCDM